MEGANKRRRIGHGEEEEDEEQKIEKFFALIKNIREARERLMNASNASPAVGNERVAEKVLEQKETAVWKPSFRREDFAEEAAPFKNTAVIVLESPRRGEEEEEAKKETDKEELDLTLSL